MEESLVVVDSSAISLGFFNRIAEYLDQSDSVAGVEAGGNDRTFYVGLSDLNGPWRLSWSLSVMELAPKSRYVRTMAYPIRSHDMSFGREYRVFDLVASFSYTTVRELRELFRSWEGMEENEPWQEIPPHMPIYMIGAGALSDAGARNFNARLKP